MATTLSPELAFIFPEGTAINSQNHLVLGGCDCVGLLKEFGSPLYVFDEMMLRNKCREYVGEFSKRYAKTLVVYASKAYLGRALAKLVGEEGLGIDVVSGGEVCIARSVAFPLEKAYFHGNNKGAEELRYALASGVGRIVVDNFHELGLLDRIAGEEGKRVKVLLRLSPGVDAHTHGHTTTGIIDSKFGFPIVTGQAEEALTRAIAASNLDLVGLHTHLGSPIFEVEPYVEATELVLEFASQMRKKYGFALQEFSPGGGFAIQYVKDNPSPVVATYAETIVSVLRKGLEKHDLGEPLMIIEPGRSIVGRAGVALYTVGATKDIPGIRRYVSVDGGMADNIRPAIYGSKYEAVVANKAADVPAETVTIAGKFCESGDILIKDIALPKLSAGDVIAIPASGAYCLTMASNYNAALKPAIVMVKNGQARLIRRRETLEDLIRCDVLED